MCGLSDETSELIVIFLQLVPAGLYIMGLIEGKKGRNLFLFGVFFHVLSIVQRGIVIGGVPLTDKPDNISFMALSMAVSYLYFHEKNLTGFGTFALPLISALLMVSVGFKPVDTVSPFLKSIWFYAHICLYFTGIGLFGISSSIGVYHLFIDKDTNYEKFQYKAGAIGWAAFTVSLVAGSIWFYEAYGTYWLWTSKELWMALTWFYYGLYLHARLIPGLSGRPAVVLGVLGFPVALFGYFGVGTIIPAPPTQF